MSRHTGRLCLFKNEQHQLSFVLARFRLVAQISIWSSLVGLVERSLEDGGTVWEYRYTGVSSPMLLPITEAWCIHAALRPAKGVALLVEKGLWSIAGSELRLPLGALGTDC